MSGKYSEVDVDTHAKKRHNEVLSRHKRHDLVHVVILIIVVLGASFAIAAYVCCHHNDEFLRKLELNLTTTLAEIQANLTEIIDLVTVPVELRRSLKDKKSLTDYIAARGEIEDSNGIGVAFAVYLQQYFFDMTVEVCGEFDPTVGCTLAEVRECACGT